MFALRRLIVGTRRPAIIASAERGFKDAAARLDHQLFAPLALRSETPVVLIPTGVLHGLPWASLSSLADRPTTVAPSAAMWRRQSASNTDASTSPRVLLVAGPGLPGAEDEISQLADLYPTAHVLTGKHATVASVLAAIEQADLVHLAAHGSFRADSPLFSSVQLADGPLTVYELERLRSFPALMVLSACDAAAVDVRTGDELLGTATALLSLGVQSIIAPVIPVPDDATAALMVSLHQHLRRSESPAAALGRALREARGRAGPHDLAAASAFICMGTHDSAARQPDLREFSAAQRLPA
jgi:CHAT domain-containing protein